jgi:diguanylate cyclase (GGDEF)-like protein
MGKTVEAARHKLHVAAVIALVFLVTLLLLIRGLLVRPLQKFDTALARLNEERPALQLPACTLHEVRTIETAITQLHDALAKHEQTREELEKLAATDMLTGLHNRRNFMALAQAEIARSQRYGRPVSVALADLDHFKLVNDEHGHAVGDLALRAFADMVRDTLRTTDIAGRYGGEEFAFVFPETTPQEAAVLAERLRQRFEKLVITLDNGHALRLTTSLGVADASAISIEDALRYADHALYEAKAGGRNAVVMSAAVSGIGFIGER